MNLYQYEVHLAYRHISSIMDNVFVNLSISDLMLV